MLIVSCSQHNFFLLRMGSISHRKICCFQYNPKSSFLHPSDQRLFFHYWISSTAFGKMQREIFMTATFFLTLLYQSKRYNCTLFLTMNLFFFHFTTMSWNPQIKQFIVIMWQLYLHSCGWQFAYLLLDIFDTDERLASGIHTWSSSHVIYTQYTIQYVTTTL